MIPILPISAAALLLSCSGFALAVPSSNIGRQSFSPRDIGLPSTKRATSNLAGYLGAFFLGDNPDVYFYISDGNNGISFSALNGGNPILVPTVGTGGVRDPAIVKGGGDEEGQKWYIVGTDLDISKVGNRQRRPPFGLEWWKVLTGMIDNLGCIRKDRFEGNYHMGEYKSGRLDQREARHCGRWDCRHGLGPRGDLGWKQG